MTKERNMILFKGHEIRVKWDKETEEYYFS